MGYRPTKAAVNLAAIRTNLQNFRERAGDAKVIAVVKANGYGHGALRVAQTALDSGADMLAVATPDEAAELRAAGIHSELLVLGAVPVSFIPYAQAERIAVTAISMEWIDMARAAADSEAEPLKVHLKVDTGMRRVGVEEGEAREAARALQEGPFRFEGVFTHFATADEADSELFVRQVHSIRQVTGRLGDATLLVHASNSAAALMHPEVAFDAVRVGISMYGIPPSPYVKGELPFNLYPALSLETEIVHIKRVAAGESLSYGATYTAGQDEWIATLPIGYGDGMLRGLQGQEVLVQGERVPVVGRICMDQCLIRLPRRMPVGEKVQLIGVQGSERIFIDEWADKLGTIPYEVACILTQRVPRVYFEEPLEESYSFHGKDMMLR